MSWGKFCTIGCFPLAQGKVQAVAMSVLRPVPTKLRVEIQVETVLVGLAWKGG